MHELYRLDKTATGTTYTMIGKATTVSGALGLAVRAGTGRYQVWNADGHKCASVKIDLPVTAETEPLRIAAVNRIADLLAG
jgi:hypothetical protein